MLAKEEHKKGNDRHIFQCKLEPKENILRHRYHGNPRYSKFTEIIRQFSSINLMYFLCILFASVNLKISLMDCIILSKLPWCFSTDCSLKHLLLKFAKVIKVRHTNYKFVTQRFIQAILMFGKRHKKLNLLIESLRSIWLQFYFQAYRNRLVSNLH